MAIDKRRKAVLILECDSAKLAQQGLAFGDLLHESIGQGFRKIPITVLKVFDLEKLLEDLADLYRTGQKYRTVILIGHSNRKGLQIAEDMFLDWKAVANFFPLFEPNRIIALACEAGRWQPCAAIFGSLPTLKEIFASPLPADKSQAAIVVGKTIHVLGLSREDTRLNNLMQIVNFALTGNVMIHHTRKEFEDANDEDRKVWDEVVEPTLDVLSDLFGGNRNV